MSSLGKLTVLIVDDNQYMISIVSAILRGFGVGRVISAKDGSAALEIVRSDAVDIMITDYNMGFLNGDELVRLIRTSSDSKNRFIPIIMLTGHSEASKVKAARDAGVDEFVRKPVTAAELFTKIRAVVERPRPYVESRDFFGPDRRRRKIGDFSGDNRRKGS